MGVVFDVYRPKFRFCIANKSLAKHNLAVVLLPHYAYSLISSYYIVVFIYQYKPKIAEVIKRLLQFISFCFCDFSWVSKTSVYKGYKRDKIEMRGDRAEMSDFPLYLNTVAGGLDRRDQAISGFSFVVKIYAVPVVEIIG